MPKSELKHVQWVDIQGTVKTYQYVYFQLSIINIILKTFVAIKTI